MNVVGEKVSQFAIDIFKTASFENIVPGHQTAICALGVGQPSTISKEEFVSIDHDAVLAFAVSCKRAGVQHFELLSSVGASATSSSFFLNTKGKLEEALKSLDFARLSLFHPSLIVTPTNRYGIAQAIALTVTPIINPLLLGPLRKFRAIPVTNLGKAMATNILNDGEGIETLYWDDFLILSSSEES
jgi:uncharacterized protein YbjT (DUF2867 family)